MRRLETGPISRRSFLRNAGAAVAAGLLTSGRALAVRPTDDDILDVVIIGAGLAGLTAARDLRRAGNASFVVLEARQRVGGRTLNHQLRNGFISEAGGQWIGPGQTAVADLARELGVETFKSDYHGRSVYRMGEGRVVVDTQGELQVEPSVATELEALARTVRSHRPWTAPRAEELDKLSLGDWLDSKGVNAIDRLTWQFASILTAGAAVSKVSLLYYLSMVNFARSQQGLEGQKEGAQESRFSGGSQILCSLMAEALGDHVQLDHPVTEIRNWDKAVVEVQTPQGVVRGRKIVIALSPPLCNQVAFSPALPSARQALQGRWPAHAPIVKTATVYSSPFWFDKGYNGQVASVDGPVIWSFDNSPPKKELGVLNAFMRPAEMPSDPDLAKTAVAQVFAEAMQDDRFLNPLEFHVQDWGQEPYTLTCVSPLPPGFLTSGLMPALSEPVGSLIWAGTETADLWNGYMDGAVRSGHQAALVALQSLVSPRSV